MTIAGRSLKSGRRSIRFSPSGTIAARIPIKNYIDQGALVEAAGPGNVFVREGYPALYAKATHTVAKPGDKVAISGDKLQKKYAYRHSGFPGGLRKRALGDEMEKHADRVVERAIETPHRSAVPARTKRRWSARLRSAARLLIALLSTTAASVARGLVRAVGLDGTRRDLVRHYAAGAEPASGQCLAELAAWIHRLERGVRLM